MGEYCRGAKSSIGQALEDISSRLRSSQGNQQSRQGNQQRNPTENQMVFNLTKNYKNLYKQVKVITNVSKEKLKRYNCEETFRIEINFENKWKYDKFNKTAGAHWIQQGMSRDAKKWASWFSKVDRIAEIQQQCNSDLEKVAMESNRCGMESSRGTVERISSKMLTSTEREQPSNLTLVCIYKTPAGKAIQSKEVLVELNEVRTLLTLEIFNDITDIITRYRMGYKDRKESIKQVSTTSTTSNSQQS